MLLEKKIENLDAECLDEGSDLERFSAAIRDFQRMVDVGVATPRGYNLMTTGESKLQFARNHR